MISQDTSSSKRLATAIYPATSAQEKNERKISTLNSSNQSLMNVPTMDQEASPYIFLGSRYYTPEFSMQSGILKLNKKPIQSFLRQMERYLTTLHLTCASWVLIESFGVGGGITLTMRPASYSRTKDSSGSLSKKLQKGRLRSGKGLGRK